MALLGYGEDALTFHALSAGYSDLLRNLGDTARPGETIRFFRPSFGRRGSSRTSLRSEFGEFDAIVGTTTAVYLVEAKWASSGEYRKNSVSLRAEQKRRHAAFRAYLDAWRRRSSDDWSAFAEGLRSDLLTLNLLPPKAGTTLARNLAWVLRRLDSCGTSTVDVLLFSCLSHDARRPQECEPFRVVTHFCRPEPDGNFITLIG